MIRYALQEKTGLLLHKTHAVDLEGKPTKNDKGEHIVIETMAVLKHQSGGVFNVPLTAVPTYAAKGNEPASIDDAKAAFIAGRKRKQPDEKILGAEFDAMCVGMPSKSKSAAPAAK